MSEPYAPAEYLRPAFLIDRHFSGHVDAVGNQVLLLCRDRRPEEEVITYGVGHALTDAEREARGLRFYKDPLWRSYAFNYTSGRDLVAAFLDQAADKTTAFQRLLCEPFSPGQIRQFVTSAA